MPLTPAIAQQIMIVSWFPATFIAMTFGLLLFPDGQLPSPRWRPMAWFNAVTVGAGTLGLAVLYHPWSSIPVDSFDSSFGSLVETIVIVAQVGALGAVVSLIARYRNSDQIRRLQIRWIAAGAAFVVVAFVLVLVAWGGVGGEGGAVYTIVLLVPLAGLILSFGIAISRYDLFDIDLVVSKSVTYLGLAATITLVYATIVAIPVLLLGRSGDGGSILFPVAAAAVVAIVFDPVRGVMHRWANRLVYGERSTPYEVLSRMTAVLAEARSGAGVDDLAALLAAGTGASRATVWTQDHDVLTPVGSWPADQLPGLTSIGLDDIARREDTVVATIRRGEQSLGALSVSKPRNDPVTDRDRQLLADAAGTAGLLLRNLALNGELQARARELEASRSRLIAAQDAARQRLERDLHDGAQQRVVALRVKLGIAETLAAREGAGDVGSAISSAGREAQQAVDDLRRVAHGIYPPLLETAGLVAALNDLDGMAPTRVEIDDNVSDRRYDPTIEKALYFSIRELGHSARDAGARHLRVDLSDAEGDVLVGITADAALDEAALAAVADRAHASNGEVEVTARGPGQTVAMYRFRSPVADRQPA